MPERPPSSPALKRVTVRLADPLHGLLEGAAQREGVSLAQYLREAAILREAWSRGLLMGANPRTMEGVHAGMQEARRMIAELSNLGEG